MSARIQVIDETPAGEILRTLELLLSSSTVTARTIIEQRVRAEVEAFNERPEETRFHGFVQPTQTEAELNGYRFKTRRSVDPDAQVARAISAFEANGFFMLAHGKQIESLDEPIPMTEPMEVSFIKLVALVGG